MAHTSMDRVTGPLSANCAKGSLGRNHGMMYEHVYEHTKVHIIQKLPLSSTVFLCYYMLFTLRLESIELLRPPKTFLKHERELRFPEDVAPAMRSEHKHRKESTSRPLQKKIKKTWENWFSAQAAFVFSQFGQSIDIVLNMTCDIYI